METKQATESLAFRLKYGGGDPRHPSVTATAALRRAMSAGAAWNWERAGGALEEAYRALGAEPPQSANIAGWDWHCGVHPIQLVEFDEWGQVKS